MRILVFNTVTTRKITIVIGVLLCILRSTAQRRCL